MNVWLWNPLEQRFDEPKSDISSWTLVAADSWFVENGQVRAFDRHRARFARAAAQVGIGEAVAGEFWAAVVDKIPATGEWFPRVDVLEEPAGAGHVLAFRLRSAPARTRELTVLVPPYSDPRTTPERKGPDIALLERVRTDAREQFGCDEVLLISEDRYVVEGATTSLLWWDGETLCAPDSELGALPGVTSAVVLEEARARSIPVEFRRVRPDDLLGYEVWLVNALHSIRRANQFVNVLGVGDAETFPATLQRGTGSAGRSGENLYGFDRWRDWIEAMRVPLIEFKNGEKSLGP